MQKIVFLDLAAPEFVLGSTHTCSSERAKQHLGITELASCWSDVKRLMI